MAYPSTIATLTNPAPTDRLNSPSHSGIETAQNTGITEIETFVGTLSSAVGTLVYDIRSANSNGGGHVQTVNKGGTGQTSYTKGDLLVASSSSVLAKLGVGLDNQAIVADNTQPAGIKWGAVAVARYGGTGADGALSVSVSSVMDLGSAEYVEKNYTSISITGTGSLAFSNPANNGTIVVLRSQGSVLLTSTASSMIALTDIGGKGGTAGAGFQGGGGGSTSGPGSGYNSSGGVGKFFGQAVNTTASGTGGDGGGNLNVGSTIGVFSGYSGGLVVSLGITAGGGSSAALPPLNLYNLPLPGGGGSGGTGEAKSGGGANGGAGGRGAGALYIEAGGLNFVGSILANGTAGSSSAGVNAGAGGGGAGGSVKILYSSIIANVGTITVAAGAAGGTGVAGGAGSIGQTLIANNTVFV